MTVPIALPAAFLPAGYQPADRLCRTNNSLAAALASLWTAEMSGGFRCLSPPLIHGCGVSREELTFFPDSTRPCPSLSVLPGSNFPGFVPRYFPNPFHKGLVTLPGEGGGGSVAYQDTSR